MKQNCLFMSKILESFSCTESEFHPLNRITRVTSEESGEPARPLCYHSGVAIASTPLIMALYMVEECGADAFGGRVQTNHGYQIEST